MNGPNAASCCPKSMIDDPPVNHDVTASRIPAPVNVNIIDARVLTFVRTDSSNNLAPVIKGVRFVINMDKFVATCGSTLVAPSAIPPMMPPIN